MVGFGIPFMTLLSFFAACVIVAKMIADGDSDLLTEPRDQYGGNLLFITYWCNFDIYESYSFKREKYK